MSFITAIITLCIIILLALLVNRIATVALMFTGMSKEMAWFQARSAFSTVGFTTTESESVVNHPVRRRIISILMLMGNAGFIGLIATVLGTLTGEASRIGVWQRMGILVIVLLSLWLIGMSKWLDSWMQKIITRALKRWSKLEVHDFVALLHLGEGFSITELKLDTADWLVDKRLDELRLSDIGINILGIHRPEEGYAASLTGATYCHAGDKLLIYGKLKNIIELDEKRSDPEAGRKHFEMAEKNKRQWQRDADYRAEGYSVTEFVVRKEGWMMGKRLVQLRFTDIGVMVLGIERIDGTYIGTPTGSDQLRTDDKIIVYGSLNNLATLEQLHNDPDGELKHQELVEAKHTKRMENN